MPLPFNVVETPADGNVLERDEADTGITVFIVIAQAVPAAVYCLLIQLYGTKILGVSMLFNECRPSTWILPVLSLSIGNIAYYAMWLRRYMVDESNKDYVRFARAKGVNESKIVYRHILRNAIVPLAQYIPQSILLTIAGSIYVENLYSVPGMGGLLIQVICEKRKVLLMI